MPINSTYSSLDGHADNTTSSVPSNSLKTSIAQTSPSPTKNSTRTSKQQSLKLPRVTNAKKNVAQRPPHDIQALNAHPRPKRDLAPAQRKSQHEQVMRLLAKKSQQVRASCEQYNVRSPPSGVSSPMTTHLQSSPAHHKHRETDLPTHHNHRHDHLDRTRSYHQVPPLLPAGKGRGSHSRVWMRMRRLGMRVSRLRRRGRLWRPRRGVLWSEYLCHFFFFRYCGGLSLIHISEPTRPY